MNIDLFLILYFWQFWFMSRYLPSSGWTLFFILISFHIDDVAANILLLWLRFENYTDLVASTPETDEPISTKTLTTLCFASSHNSNWWSIKTCSNSVVFVDFIFLAVKIGCKSLWNFSILIKLILFSVDFSQHNLNCSANFEGIIEAVWTCISCHFQNAICATCLIGII